MNRTYAAILALTLAASPAIANDMTLTAKCAPRALLVEKLTTEFEEVQQGLGLANGNNVLEIFANIETGTWTVLMSRLDGTPCMVAAGEQWEAGAPPQGETL